LDGAVIGEHQPIADHDLSVWVEVEELGGAGVGGLVADLDLDSWGEAVVGGVGEEGSSAGLALGFAQSSAAEALDVAVGSDEQTTAMFGDDQALGTQLGDGLSDGDPGRAEQLAEFSLRRQLRARCVGSLPDLFAQLISDLTVCRYTAGSIYSGHLTSRHHVLSACAGEDIATG
jgi:hypothetical protein